MDAGCEDEEVLSHCRGESTQHRDSWVVNLILAKE
jgi:hypothetical protein